MVLQPGHALGVQVVGGFVQKQNIWLGQQQTAHGHPTALTPGEINHWRITGRAAQCVHSQIQAAVQGPNVVLVHLFLHLGLFFHQLVKVSIWLGKFGADLIVFKLQIDQRLHRFLDNFFHRLGVVQLRFLLQHATGIALAEDSLTQVIVIHTSHDFEQSAFTRAVQAQHANLGTIVKPQRNIAQDLFVWWDHFAHLHHRVNYLSICHRKNHTNFNCVLRAIAL